MKLTSRGRRQIATSLFPGNFWVFRNLSLRVLEGGVQTAPLPFSVQQWLIPRISADLATKAADNPKWRGFRGITQDRLELVEPVGVKTAVSPRTWWCTRCKSLTNGPVSKVGIKDGICPKCRTQTIIQLASIFVCPTCHDMKPVEAVVCPQCNDSRSVILEGREGRRREYRWRCSKHPDFELYVRRNCVADGSRMVLKSTGGRIYYPERLTEVSAHASPEGTQQSVGDLCFSPSHAAVVDIVVGRIPVADLNEYFRKTERSPIEPFRNVHTGNFMAFVSRLETDAIAVTARSKFPSNEEANLFLHSLKHALLNAAPAVTGLTQDEFGASLNPDTQELLIYDNVLGGSGGCRLLAGRRLRRWLHVARELAECHQVQCEDACRACLFLPTRLCRQGNRFLSRSSVLELIPDDPDLS